MVNNFEMDYAKKSTQEAYLDDNGVMRWMSNDAVVPKDMVKMWVEIGFMSVQDAEKNLAAEKKENEEFFGRKDVQEYLGQMMDLAEKYQENEVALEAMFS
jgi:hypothetical protein